MRWTTFKRHRTVHRDVKPQNLIVNSDGTHLLLTDFGLVKPLKPGTRLTGTKSTVGTLSYMSPEQRAGQRLGRLSDVYSLGATLYRCLTGIPPAPDIVSNGRLRKPSASNKVCPKIGGRHLSAMSQIQPEVALPIRSRAQPRSATGDRRIGTQVPCPPGGLRCRRNGRDNRHRWIDLVRHDKQSGELRFPAISDECGQFARKVTTGGDLTRCASGTTRDRSDPTGES